MKQLPQAKLKRIVESVLVEKNYGIAAYSDGSSVDSGQQAALKDEPEHSLGIVRGVDTDGYLFLWNTTYRPMQKQVTDQEFIADLDRFLTTHGVTDYHIKIRSTSDSDWHEWRGRLDPGIYLHIKPEHLVKKVQSKAERIQQQIANDAAAADKRDFLGLEDGPHQSEYPSYEEYRAARDRWDFNNR